MKWQRLPREFFLRDAEIVAEELVGKLLVRQTESEMYFLRITETEVYKGETDTACHASRGKTKRNAPLYEAGGRYYLYLCYGVHWLMNVVTGKEGEPQGVLIRACEGAEGPGKLTKALGIDGRFRESDAEDETLYFVSDGAAPSICRKKRVGIGYASKEDQDRLWRFASLRKKERESMILQKRTEAERLFREEGYNCAQAVAAAFCEETGISKEQSVTLVSGFGGGIGRLRETCGAVSGMVFVLSALYGNYDPNDQTAKKDIYRAVQEVAAAFSGKNGSIICRVLLEGCQVTEGVTPEKRDTKAYQKRPCYTYVADAAEAVASFIAKHPIGEKLQFPD